MGKIQHICNIIIIVVSICSLIRCGYSVFPIIIILMEIVIIIIEIKTNKTKHGK